jgi:hypothetical protein
MSVMNFMRCSFVTDKDQLIHLLGSLINSPNKKHMQNYVISLDYTPFKIFRRFYRKQFNPLHFFLLMNDTSAAFRCIWHFIPIKTKPLLLSNSRITIV